MDKIKNNIIYGKFNIIHIKSSFKNTIITLTTYQGKIFKRWSTKSLKKIDLRKNTPYNIQKIIIELNKYIESNKLNYFFLIFKGKGKGRFQFLKNFNKKNIIFLSILDKTPIVFNGCKPKKEKRR